MVHEAYTAIGRQFLGLGWSTTEEFATKNRDVVERFARVMREANVYCNSHQADTADMMAELAKVDPAIEHRMKRVTFAEYVIPAQIQPLVDATAKYKVIDTAFNAQELVSPYALRPPAR